jgi:hypothetical protein
VETLRITFRKTAAGPDWLHHEGDIVDLPVDEAKRLIADGAAIEADPEDKPKKLSKPALLKTKDSGPFSDEEWAMGISLNQWAQWRVPDAFAQIQAADSGILVLGDRTSSEEGARRELWKEARAILQDQLWADLATDVVGLGEPPTTPPGEVQRVSLAALPEVVKGLGMMHGTLWTFFRKKRIEMRLYKAARSTEINRTTGKDETGGLAGEALGGDDGRAPKGKRGRKPKWDWDGAAREMMRIADSLDGLPKVQADLERLITDWFESNNEGRSPAESEIRKFVVKRLPPDYRAE